MRNLLIICAGLLSIFSYAQTDPVFFNSNSFNPAFVGTKDNLSVGVNYFVDYIDDPDFSSKVFMANVYTPINHKFGIGLAFSNLNFDVIKEKNLHLDLSYKYDFSKFMSFSLWSFCWFYQIKNKFYRIIIT